MASQPYGISEGADSKINRGMKSEAEHEAKREAGKHTGETHSIPRY